jgi:predicted DCC family thiol-disulfide oxidoreductase YuxK
MVNKAHKLSVYFDGDCYLCSLEINQYRKKDRQNQIQFVNISSPEFDARAVGLDPDRVQKYFHVRKVGGDLLQGVPAFVAIWETLASYRFLAKLAKIKLVRTILELGYSLFVGIRPYLPRRQCESGVCKI